MTSIIEDKNTEILSENNSTKNGYKISNNYSVEIVWPNVIKFAILHALALYGLYAGICGEGKWYSIVWYQVIAFISTMGVQVGAHRLWCHRCFKAKLALRVLLMIMQTIALQNDIYEWCRDLRVHHKYSDTDADPHNSSRGFFFCHMGWLLCRKHPDVKEKGSTVDLSDIWADPVVRFQVKHYILLVLVFWGVFPIVIPMYCFSETLFFCICGNAFRYIQVLHITWTVNSVAHLWGRRPYDKSINPRDSPLVIYWGFGEGYHNYHHVFPYDYSASEFGWKVNWNPATAFIDFFAWIGWAYDLKTAPRNTVSKKLDRNGDPMDRTDKVVKISQYWTDFLFGLIASTLPLIITLILRIIFTQILIS